MASTCMFVGGGEILDSQRQSAEWDAIHNNPNPAATMPNPRQLRPTAAGNPSTGVSRAGVSRTDRFSERQLVPTEIYRVDYRVESGLECLNGVESHPG